MDRSCIMLESRKRKANTAARMGLVSEGKSMVAYNGTRIASKFGRGYMVWFLTFLMVGHRNILFSYLSNYCCVSYGESYGGNMGRNPISTTYSSICHLAPSLCRDNECYLTYHFSQPLTHQLNSNVRLPSPEIFFHKWKRSRYRWKR